MQYRGIGPHLSASGKSHGFSRVAAGTWGIFLGTLWCSIKKIETPYLSDSELWIALHKMQRNQASSPNEGYVSWDFSSCGRNMGYILELQRGWPFESPHCSAKSGLLSSYDGHLRNLN